MMICTQPAAVAAVVRNLLLVAVLVCKLLTLVTLVMTLLNGAVRGHTVTHATGLSREKWFKFCV